MLGRGPNFLRADILSTANAAGVDLLADPAGPCMCAVCMAERARLLQYPTRSQDPDEPTPMATKSHFDVLAQQYERAIEERYTPVKDGIDHLKRLLTVYEGDARRRAEWEVGSRISAALGVKPPPDPAVLPPTDLVAALEGLLAQLRPQAAIVEASDPEDDPCPEPEPPRPPRVVVAAPKESLPGDHPGFPSWPHLRAYAERHGLHIVAGLRVGEKLVVIKKRYGLSPEWVEIVTSAPRAVDAVERRIAGGKMGAVVFLEGTVSHAAFGKIRDACKRRGVPFAYGGRACVGELHYAFASLDARLGQAATG